MFHFLESVFHVRRIHQTSHVSLSRNATRNTRDIVQTKVCHARILRGLSQLPYLPSVGVLSPEL